MKCEYDKEYECSIVGNNWCRGGTPSFRNSYCGECIGGRGGLPTVRDYRKDVKSPPDLRDILVDLIGSVEIMVDYLMKNHHDSREVPDDLVSLCWELSKAREALGEM